MDDQQIKQLDARKIRTALVLLSVVAVFFLGVILRHWR
ncbi:MAG TPA: cytochrome oxidase small assembly protein [Burkholderiales bacterium]|jgi:hypothetical protein|nr:cytochrome oxidase small assembly protein [Burkholderiales bacterium]